MSLNQSPRLEKVTSSAVRDARFVGISNPKPLVPFKLEAPEIVVFAIVVERMRERGCLERYLQFMNSSASCKSLCVATESVPP